MCKGLATGPACCCCDLKRLRLYSDRYDLPGMWIVLVSAIEVNNLHCLKSLCHCLPPSENAVRWCVPSVDVSSQSCSQPSWHVHCYKGTQTRCVLLVHR